MIEEEARKAPEAPDRTDAKAARTRSEENERTRLAILGWAARGGSLADLRAILAPALLCLGLLLAGCAGPRTSEVRTFASDVRLLLGVVAPCSTLTSGEASAARALAAELDATARTIGGGP